jgi:hypothetical protein
MGNWKINNVGVYRMPPTIGGASVAYQIAASCSTIRRFADILGFLLIGYGGYGHLLKPLADHDFATGKSGGGRREYIPIGFRSASMPLKPPPDLPVPKSGVLALTLYQKHF